jgi:hypothetical protein
LRKRGILQIHLNLKRRGTRRDQKRFFFPPFLPADSRFQQKGNWRLWRLGARQFLPQRGNHKSSLVNDRRHEQSGGESGCGEGRPGPRL